MNRRTVLPFNEQSRLDHALRTALHDESVDRVHDALAQGANPNTVDLDTCEPLTVVLLRGPQRRSIGINTVLALLLTAGADPDAQALDGDRLVMVAIDNGHRDATQRLLAAHANLWPHAPGGRNVVYLLAREGWSPELRQCLPSLPTHRDRTVSPTGWTPLQVAAYHGHTEVCQVLLDAGAYRRTVDIKGRTARALAIDNQRWAVQALFDHRSLTALADRVLPSPAPSVPRRRL